MKPGYFLEIWPSLPEVRKEEKKKRRKGKKEEGGGELGKVLCFMPLSFKYTPQPETAYGLQFYNLVYDIALSLWDTVLYLYIYGLVMGTVIL